VSSLDDALRALELKPVHDAVIALMDAALLRSLAESTAPAAEMGVKKKDASSKVVPAAKDGQLEQVLTVLRHRLSVVLAEAKRLAATPDGESAGLKPARDWAKPKVDPAEHLIARIKAALRLPQIEAALKDSFSKEAADVLPSSVKPIESNIPLWATVVAWAALEAMGLTLDEQSPDRAAVSEFDALRLREPLAQSFERLGMHGEDRWRAVARIRASFAHAAWSPAPQPASRAALSWEQDPEVGWLIGVHEYDGVRYFNKEAFERIVWWSALPAFLTLAGEKKIDEADLAELQEQIARRLEIAEKGGYQVDALLDAARLTVTKSEEPKRQLTE
jgi:hypothetical protein